MTPEEGRFLLDQAEKILKDTVDTNALIVTRTTTLITIASTGIIALIGFAINRNDTKGFDKEVLTSIVVIGHLMWINWDLFKLVLPRGYYSYGSKPRRFFIKQIFDQHKDNRLKIMYASEIEEYQRRILFNEGRNDEKWALYTKALSRIVFAPALLIIAYLLFWALLSLLGCQR